MKNFMTRLMTSAALLVSLGATAASLQAQSMNLKADVPFAWEANGHQLNAGEYLITKDAQHLITVRNNNTGKGMYVQVVGGSRGNPTCRLVFHRYGEQYFLSEIVGVSGESTRVPVSKAERAVQSEQPREMAIVTVEVKPLFN